MKPLLMGILNITPDSFSDGGMFINPQIAIKHGEVLIAQGASIIDIGGESTRPNSSEVTQIDELKRIQEVVKVLAKINKISVDTFREETAKTCLELGAKIINDVSALRYSPNLAKIIAEHDAEVVLMHSKQTANSPHATSEYKEYDDVIFQTKEFLEKRIEYALSQGIDISKIILDPGMGTFISSNPSYSWEVLYKLDQLCDYFKDFRILIGTSRKGFLGKEAIDPLSQFTALIGASKGAKIIRTHNVEMMSEFCKALDFSIH